MAINWPPHPAHPHGPRRGLVLNIFLEPEHRGRGVARALMEASEKEFIAPMPQLRHSPCRRSREPLCEWVGWLTTAEMAKAIIRLKVLIAENWLRCR